ncbi:GDP-L-galactose phosphorylase 1-like [Panicum miliaceum]|uniref:GDP-L-galactose phosphorylase 1-like n=1 Tax=Panicum miliaceum TaxID=4540 RepID=A0A3L6R5D2_PANMI|nr:GDP-L-galactose phosphorylase 1-like [Panicum miliaceum]
MVSATKVEGEYSFLSKNSHLDQSEGVKTHLYHFGAEHGNDDLKSTACPEQGPSLLDTILLSQWDNFAWKGHLDYDVTACQLKVIEGGVNFVGQLNNKWNSFSLKEYDKLFESFRFSKPNSMKSYEGLLLCVAQGENDRPEVAPSASPPKDGLLLIANAYPVEYGHIFLVPAAVNQLSCYWDKRMFGLATKIASEACYFANPLPVESASTIVVYEYGGNARSDIIVSETVGYPLKALVFTSNNLKALVNVVSEICFSLHDNTTAYSLLISNNGTKVFLFPQVKNLVTGCSLSTWECGGYFIYHTKFEFDNASETEISKRMASVSLQDSAFEDLKHLCCAIAHDLVK